MDQLRYGEEDKKLVAFLFILMREEIPVGKIERILRDHIDRLEGELVFDGKHTAALAIELAKRLMPQPTVKMAEVK